MKCYDAQPAVAAVGEVLKVSKELIHQVTVVSQIGPAPTSRATEVATQEHDDVAMLAQPHPRGLSGGVAGRHVLIVVQVLTHVVLHHKGMVYDDHFFVRISRKDGLGPVQRCTCWPVLKPHEQVL